MDRTASAERCIAEMLTVMGQASDGAWAYDMDARTLRRCPRWYASLGLPPSEAAIPVEAALARIHDDDRPEVEAALASGDHAYGGLDYTYRVRAADGSWLWVRERGGPADMDALGGRAFLIGSIVAVEQNPADQSLRESEKRYRLLAKNLPGAIFRYLRYADGRDGIEYMSPGCALIWELSTSDLQADPTPIWAMVHPDDMPGMVDSVTASAETLTPWCHVWRITTPSGRTKWLHGRGQPEARGDGTVVWHSLILDITEQKTAEAEAQAAMIAAEASNHAKTHFLASMSHEIRTPLNSIIGFAEIMAGEHFGAHAEPRYKDYSGLIAKSATHLYGLLGDLLDVSRIEAGEVKLEEEAIDLAEAVGFCTTLLNERSTARAIDLIVEGIDGVWLQADPTRFRQALLNPLSNAIRHTPRGGRITVRLTVDDQLRLEVIDTGEGMSPEDIRKLDAPFGSGARSPYTTQHGAGIGLYITRNILHAHGGDLRISSDLGRGTCVSLLYPLNRLIPAHEAAAADGPPADTSATPGVAS